MSSSRWTRQGFTLIELMVVVALISILSAVAIPKFTQTLSKTKEKVNVANKEVIKQALFSAAVDGGGWPNNDAVAWACLGPTGVICTGSQGNFATQPTVLNAIAPYLHNLPVWNVPANVYAYAAYDNNLWSPGVWLWWTMEPGSPDIDCTNTGGGTYIINDATGYRFCIEQIAS